LVPYFGMYDFPLVPYFGMYDFPLVPYFGMYLISDRLYSSLYIYMIHDWCRFRFRVGGWGWR
jgi:hypothetical protein